MHQVIDREILLSFDEMRILLYNMGFKSIRGILMPQEEFRREEIIRSMHHMSLHGMICFTEEGFQIRPDLEELLRVIGEDRSDFILGPYADGSAFFAINGASISIRVTVGLSTFFLTILYIDKTHLSK